MSPLDPALGLQIVNGLLNVLRMARDGRIERTEQFDKALDASLAASIATYSYLGQIREPDAIHRDWAKEAELARLWGNAAVPLRHLDKDLADRCQIKAFYWTGPEGWTQGEIDEARIGIDKIASDIQDLRRKRT